MKKTIVILLVILSLGTVAFAKGGFTLKGGITYDFVNIKSAESSDGSIFRPDSATWRANAFGAEFGVTYNFSEKFLVYGDSSLGFYNKFTIGDIEITNDSMDKVSFIATTEHFGAATNINLSRGLDLQVGGGFAFSYARVEASETEDGDTESEALGIFAIGVGLYGNINYSISEKVALSFTVHPDLLFLSGDHVETSESHIVDKTIASITYSWTTFGAVASFKFNATVGVTFKF